MTACLGGAGLQKGKQTAPFNSFKSLFSSNHKVNTQPSLIMCTVREWVVSVTSCFLHISIYVDFYTTSRETSITEPNRADKAEKEREVLRKQFLWRMFNVLLQLCAIHTSTHLSRSHHAYVKIERTNQVPLSSALGVIWGCPLYFRGTL